MEIVRHEESKTRSAFLSSNDNRRIIPSMGRSIVPEDAVAQIYKPSRSVMTSGKARMKGWRLVFEGRSAPFIEPLMGYTGGSDTLVQVEIQFPTLESAIQYAERQGLTYVVQQPNGSSHVFSNATRKRLGLERLQQSSEPERDEWASERDAAQHGDVKGLGMSVWGG